MLQVPMLPISNLSSVAFGEGGLGIGIGYWQHFHIFTFPTYLKITIRPVGLQR